MISNRVVLIRVNFSNYCYQQHQDISSSIFNCCLWIVFS